jgi:hypothetical protein
MRYSEVQAGLGDFGIHLPGAELTLDGEHAVYARNHALAMDAQPTLITTPNSGVPAFLTTFVDPTLIEVLTAPMRAAQILGEAKKGDWVTDTAMFPVIEYTGEVSTYGDYNNNGNSGGNVNWVSRQSYHYQTFTMWGEKELERMGAAKIGWAAAKTTASALVLNKFQNRSYLFGISGLLNFGLLNDPTLSAPIQPGPKAFGSLTHGPWVTAGAVTATPNEVYNDIQSLYQQLIVQGGGNIDMESPMKLVIPTVSQIALTAANSFGVTAKKLIADSFPNLTFWTVPEYATNAGNVVQLIVDNIEGQDTGSTAFTEKMRAHPVIVGASDFKQKKSQGTWGAIITQPLAIAQMLGV